MFIYMYIMSHFQDNCNYRSHVYYCVTSPSPLIMCLIIQELMLSGAVLQVCSCSTQELSCLTFSGHCCLILFFIYWHTLQKIKIWTLGRSSTCSVSVKFIVIVKHGPVNNAIITIIIIRIIDLAPIVDKAT